MPIIAAIANLALAALLVGVSGFLFGSGPESMHAGALMAVAYIVAVIASTAAPIAGFVLNKRGKSGAGLAVALLPLAGAVIALMIPTPTSLRSPRRCGAPPVARLAAEAASSTRRLSFGMARRNPHLRAFVAF